VVLDDAGVLHLGVQRLIDRHATPRADATAANASLVSARGSLQGRFHGEDADSRADIAGTLCCTPKPGLTIYRIWRVAPPFPQFCLMSPPPRGNVLMATDITK
jgi:hypothetical protein